MGHQACLNIANLEIKIFLDLPVRDTALKKNLGAAIIYLVQYAPQAWG